MLLVACGGGGAGGDTPSEKAQLGATLSSIAIEPANATLVAGTSRQYKATGLYSDGTKKDLSASVTWASSSADVASVAAGGQAVGVTVGTAVISASSAGITGSTGLSVSNATLASIGITPAVSTIATHTSVQFTAVGVYTNNTTQDLTADVTWASSNGGVASLASGAGIGGLASGLAAGSTTITAAMGGITSTPVTLTVNAVDLVSLAVTPDGLVRPMGTTAAYRAIGTFSDQSTQDVTREAAWTSGDVNIATFDNESGARGRATALAEGSAAIVAQIGAVASPPVTLNVSPAELQSIALSPASLSLVVGTYEYFTATGTYTDGSTQELTWDAIWQSSAPGVVSIGNADGWSGEAYGEQPGIASITAQVGTVVSTAVDVTVTPARLLSITLSPENPRLVVGGIAHVAAVGSFDNGTTQDVTTMSTWSSSDVAIAAVSNAEGSRGRATALALGSAQITATLDGVSQTTSLAVQNEAWTQTSTIPDALIDRFDRTSVLMQVGTKVYAFQSGWGSYEGTLPQFNGTPAVVYDLATGQWSGVSAPPPDVLSDLPEGLPPTEGLGYYPRAIAPLGNGKLLLAGGGASLFNNEWQVFISQSFDSAWIFDASTGQFSPTTPMHAGRIGARAVALSNGKVLVFGGYAGRDAETGTVQTPADHDEVYDPVTGTWTQVDPLFGPLTNDPAPHVVALPNGRALVGSYGNTPQFQIFDSATGHWTVVANPQSPRPNAALAALDDGRVVSIGGAATTYLIAIPSEVFDPQTQTWSQLPGVDTNRTFSSAVRLPDGRLLMASGNASERSNLLSASSAIYDPVAGTLSQDTLQLNTARYGHAITTLADGRVFVLGGTDGRLDVRNAEIRSAIPPVQR
ncbi:MAG: Ig-like domain-containing protein [Lautropia sp.]